jgi:transglutaminase/protease-like cytokinesis protein 3
MMSRRFHRMIPVILTVLLVISAGAASFAADKTAEVCRTQDEAAAALREAMKDREESAGICLITDIAAEDSEDIISEIFEGALGHTGDPEEGDYLKFQYESCNASAKPVTENGEKAVLLTYTLSYYDDAEQEAAVDEKAGEIIGSLGLDGMDDAEKTRAIYSYLLDNVEYDYDNLADEDYTLKRTAYAALIDGKAVCQGYSAAFYRLLLAAGVDNRIIFGTGINSSGESEDHTWNIVRIGDTYYNTDVTRDDELGEDRYFLKAADPFSEDHISSEEYMTEEFASEYKISETDYGKAGISIIDHIGTAALEFRKLIQRLIEAL